MTEHPGEALSAYLDGDLDPAARAAVAAHLAACGECRALAADLDALRGRAATWRNRSQEPTDELWAGVAARIAPRPTAGAGGLPWYRRRISLGLGELAAAASLAAAVAGGVLWRGGHDDAAPAPVVAMLEPVEAPVGAVAPVDFADAQFDAAVDDLERVLRDQRDRLDPRTVLVVERNLQVIDRAIRDARDALAGDPANALLNAHLASARQRKLNLLRRAALLTEGD